MPVQPSTTEPTTKTTEHPRWRGRSAEEKAEHARLMSVKRWGDYAARILAEAPPLTEGQIRAIAAVLRRVGGGSDAS